MLLNMRRLDMIKDVPYPAQPEKPLLYAIISRHKKVGSSSAAKKETIFKKGFQAVTYIVTVGNWTPPAFTQQHSKGVAPNLRSHAIIHNTFWPYDNSTVIGLSQKDKNIWAPFIFLHPWIFCVCSRIHLFHSITIMSNMLTSFLLTWMRDIRMGEGNLIKQLIHAYLHRVY